METGISFDYSRLSTLLDGLNALVYVADMDSHELLYVNQHGISRWGDPQGKQCWELLQASRTGPCAFCNNSHLVTPDGQPVGTISQEIQNPVDGRWYLCHDQAIPWDDGRLVRLEIATDITSRKKTEIINTKTSAILKMIATNCPAEDIYDAIALMYEERHPGMRCSMLTLKGSRLFHGGAPSLPEAYCAAVDGLEYGPEIGSCGTSTYTGERVLVEDIATDHKWSELKDVALPHGLRSCWSEPIRDSNGKIMGAFGMYHDHPALPNDEELADLESAAHLAGIIMEREEREALLWKLSNSLEQSGEAVMVTDSDGLIEYVNASFSRLTGYSLAEIQETKASVLQNSQHKNGLYQQLWATISAGEVWSGQTSEKRKDGSLYPAHMTISPVKNDAGRITHFVSIHSDLSEQQRLEDQLRQAQKMEAIGTLVGGIVHDFNNSLGGIMGNLQLAKTGAAELPDVLAPLLRAETCVYLAEETIQQLRSYSRKGMVKKRPLPLTSFLKSAIKFLQVAIPENIQLQLEVPDVSLNIHADVNQIQQVLMNLLNNARDALAEVPNPSIDIRLSRFSADSTCLKRHPDVFSVDFACISISDNGCGIASRHLPHIFEPFYSTKEIDQGAGLGLAMVYGAIKSHHGFVEVISDESNPGTTFKVYLPLLDRVEAMPLHEAKAEILPGNGETILLADDNEIILETGRALLDELNYKFLTARDGVEALEVYRNHSDRIDLLLLDVVMPHMGGVEALEVIRQENPEVKAILCTGYDMENDLAKDLEFRPETVLTKPFTISELSQQLKHQLD